MKNKYGEEYKGDSKFVAECRKLQSIYRIEIGEEIRPYTDRNGNVHYYGNYISNGENPKEGCWKNFLTKCAYEYAVKRVNNREKYETIESDRLFNNLLSSQPMAFNLFCPLRNMSSEIATKVIKAALPDYPIYKVTEIELEFIPEKHMELTGDKSAMDAIIRFEDECGKVGFIAVETKYSENLGTNAAYVKDENGKKVPRLQSINAIKELQCFNPDTEKGIIEGKIPLTQIYRNFLLSEMYGLRGHDEKLESYSIILAPKRLHSTEKELESLTNGLRDEYKEKIKNIHLEDFVNAIIANCPDEYRGDFERFYDRYLNFNKLKNIE